MIQKEKKNIILAKRKYIIMANTNGGITRTKHDFADH